MAGGEVEYKGLAVTGFETPWLSGGAACGTRGMSVPLVGFSVRMKSSARAVGYDCEYTGAFLSGATVGPVRNGEACRSTRPNDPLEAIQLRIVERRSRADEPPREPAAKAEISAPAKTPKPAVAARPPREALRPSVGAKTRRPSLRASGKPKPSRAKPALSKKR
jgi:hypothetical protein